MLAAWEEGLRTTGKPVSRAATVASAMVSTRVDVAEGTPCSANRRRPVALSRQAVIAAAVLPGTPRRAASSAAGTSAYSSQVTTPAMGWRAARARPHGHHGERVVGVGNLVVDHQAQLGGGGLVSIRAIAYAAAACSTQ